MEKTRLGKTGLMVSRTSFGGIPLQRLSDEESTALLRAAYDGGISFYDTARMYSTSERKIGLALGDVRDKIVIASKTMAKTGESLEKDLETSLSELGTEYIDLYQFHLAISVPRPGDAGGLYDAALDAKANGKIRHIGVSAHRLDIATELVESGLFETMQYPMSCLASEEELALVKLCAERDVGFIAMKGLAGGLITDAKPTFAFLRQFTNVVPIWGLQYMWELEEFLRYEQAPPAMDAEMRATIEKDRAELSGDYCRGCGYCLPCPAGIPITSAARMRLFLKRMDWRAYTDAKSREAMRRINDCTHCHHCVQHCPFNLDTPRLLSENLAFYERFLLEHKA